MLSLIVCSVNPHHLKQVSKNIADTIGLDYELLVWDNRATPKSLCEVYNEMAAQAKYPYLCFLHEDVLFRTQDWGNILAAVFLEPAVGVVGIAGTKYKSKMYSGWYSGISGIDFFRIIHLTNGMEHTMFMPGTEDLNAQEVACIDGVLIACRQDVWKEVKFNQDLLKGFHFYDIDFSLRAAKSCKVMVSLEIELVHITIGGDYGNKWIKEAILFHENNKEKLPYHVGKFVPGHIENHIAQQWLDRLKNEKISFALRMKWVTNQKLYLISALWYDIVKFLFYRPFRLSIIHKHIFKKGI